MTFNLALDGRMVTGQAASHSVVAMSARESRTHIFSQFCPSLLAAAPLSVLAVTSRGGRVAWRNRARKGEGVVGGTSTGHRKWGEMKRRETM